jgi:hypothetical protein
VWSNADSRSFWSSGGTSNFCTCKTATTNVPFVKDRGEEADDYDSDVEFERVVDAMEEMENYGGGATKQS